MDHIKDMMNGLPILNKLKERLSQGGSKHEILSLLSAVQQKEVVAIGYYKGNHVVKLKSAYALYGIRDALRNYHQPVKVVLNKY
ncbi:hypothetical protein [Candidatus Synchoanobacter obligatus]|uniref:Uncharacterized protein n=1 Tax=Candidatus Synchoanobacter obligatus TaxID=2919597 RepID=A0ABT1L4G4_9GAMM|nr:hypothetical protein [Candidatus Synchoanobacter obligatus]MCP8352060.1 hypothetical protein [Candidatus Synchoanobacter obligatus]